jgi:hypothetical protein
MRWQRRRRNVQTRRPFGRQPWEIKLESDVRWPEFRADEPCTPRTHVRQVHISGCMSNYCYSIALHIRVSFLQDLAKIIKSDKRPGKDYLVVDVRGYDFIGGHIPNCRNEPSITFSDTLDDLVRDTKDVPQVIFHCALSQSRWVTARILYKLRESDCCKRYPAVQRLHR